MNYCSNCGAQVYRKIPPGDDRLRFFCKVCGKIHYENPKLVVGCIPEWKDKILLCRRAIEPRLGKWTIPAGFLENGETVSEGAKRETFEEAFAEVEILQPYGLYNLCFVNQIYLIFRAHLLNQNFQPGEESLEVKLFSKVEIPWDQLAFRVIEKTLARYFQDQPGGEYSFHVDDIQPSAVNH